MTKKTDNVEPGEAEVPQVEKPEKKVAEVPKIPTKRSLKWYLYRIELFKQDLAKLDEEDPLLIPLKKEYVRLIQRTKVEFARTYVKLQQTNPKVITADLEPIFAKINQELVALKKPGA